MQESKAARLIFMYDWVLLHVWET